MIARLREGSHLVARFFDVVSAQPLRPSEQQDVAQILRSDAERLMFWGQAIPDQRHAFGAAHHVKSRAGSRPDLVRAALLHDVGKRHAQLRTLARVVASLHRMVRRSGSERIMRYLDHGALAAEELDRAQAGGIVVDYARHHHGSRPPSITVEDWEILDAADRATR